MNDIAVGKLVSYSFQDDFEDGAPKECLRISLKK